MDVTFFDISAGEYMCFNNTMVVLSTSNNFFHACITFSLEELGWNVRNRDDWWSTDLD